MFNIYFSIFFSILLIFLVTHRFQVKVRLYFYSLTYIEYIYIKKITVLIYSYLKILYYELTPS